MGYVSSLEGKSKFEESTATVLPKGTKQVMPICLSVPDGAVGVTHDVPIPYCGAVTTHLIPLKRDFNAQSTNTTSLVHSLSYGCGVVHTHDIWSKKATT